MPPRCLYGNTLCARVACFESFEWIGDPYRGRERVVRGVDPIRRSALKEGIKLWKNAKGKVRPDGAMLAITRYFADIQIVYS